MADLHGATGTHSSNTSSDNHNHLNTNIESGTFDEKSAHHDDVQQSRKPLDDEEEDEDMDALIDELESQDGHAEEEEEGETVNAATGRVVPEDQLQTDTRIGLTESEVTARRKKYGMNQMKEEKENLILKFLGYFIGPIQFVMEVCYKQFLSSFSRPLPALSINQMFGRPTPVVTACAVCFAATDQRPGCISVSGMPAATPRRKKSTAHRSSMLTIVFCDRLLLFWLPVSKIGSILVSFAPCSCSTPPSVLSKNSKLVQLSTN